ncbi:cell division protein FtsL [Viridibacillus sp. FSL R5-0477]|uniref:cell division protein FtsL n=1 Tax=Viridibacillus TaxID=496496 RepID=UPI000570204D|nr:MULTISPECIES: cell division protein FtsL [Viridibacillus]OMC82981.1 cell division protein FtsL [Viridibacillus sp. FSL H8-0123]OMC88899.1 cell division protein FtsL [Viridibacillus sp. FSL H7-0596]OMC93527.1 cell division protein FtsL [Viridibacillus arenosi]
MALLNRQQQQTYIQQPQPTVPERTVQQPTPRPSKRILSKGERVLLVAMVTIIALLSVMNLNTQSAINTTSVEIQNIENKIDETKKQNAELSIEVSELSTYERIWNKAKELGLKLNEKNVKVVSGQ